MANNVLIAHSDPAERQWVEETISGLGLQCRSFANGQEAVSAAAADPGAAALAILELQSTDPETDGIMAQLRQSAGPPTIIITRQNDASAGIAAIKSGAADWISSPLSRQRLEISVRNLLRIQALESEIARIQNKPDRPLGIPDIIAVSHEMNRAMALAGRGAELSIPVLIEGEPGTGRAMTARAIHMKSLRANAPFVMMRGASQGQNGGETNGAAAHQLDEHWEEAEYGSLFIEEIGKLPLSKQARLAELLSAEPDEKRPQPRLICSSSQNLIQKVTERTFREDLFYRINVFPIWIPPLRDRPDDISALAEAFIARFAAEEGKQIDGLDSRATQLLQSYVWPGNVRQLETAIYRAIALAEGSVLTIHEFPQIAAQVPGFETEAPPPAPEHIEPQIYTGPAMIGAPFPFARSMHHHPSNNLPLGIPALSDDGEIRPLTEIEADAIRLALGHYRGHITEVARRLGIGRSTLYRKMREFGLDLRHN